LVHFTGTILFETQVEGEKEHMNTTKEDDSSTPHTHGTTGHKREEKDLSPRCCLPHPLSKLQRKKKREFRAVEAERKHCTKQKESRSRERCSTGGRTAEVDWKMG